MEKTKVTMVVDLVECKVTPYRMDNQVQLGPIKGFKNIRAVATWLQLHKEYAVGNTIWHSRGQW